MLLISCFIVALGVAGAVTDDFFGMKLTTEKFKTNDDANYRFRYFVKDDVTGDFKAQEETREGDSVQGSYTVGEPNGDLRTVTYTAGPGRGFEATVDVQPSGSPMTSGKLSPESATTFQDIVFPIKRFRQALRTEKPKIKNFAKGLIKDFFRTSDSDEKNEDDIVKENTEDLFTNLPATKNIEMLTEPQSTNTPKIQIFTSSESDLDSDSTSTESPDVFATKLTENLDTSTPIIKLLANSAEKNGNLPTPKINNKLPAKQLKEILSSSPEVSNTSEEVEVENTTDTSESREISEIIEKEINDVMNFVPKIPEYIFSDNETHIRFYKDPEEALLDERITQIAKQLAENSLRREYEERKLGHVIPISLRPIERSTSSYISKSFKFSPSDVPRVRPSAPVNVLTQVRILPQYVYKDAFFPKFTQIHQRLPVYTKTEKDQLVYDTVTDPQDILKMSQPEQISAVVGAESKYDTTPQEPVPSIPVQIPTFVQFFTPLQRFFMNTQKSFVPNTKSEFLISPQDLTTSAIPVTNDAVYYAQTTMSEDRTTEKS